MEKYKARDKVEIPKHLKRIALTLFALFGMCSIQAQDESFSQDKIKDSETIIAWQSAIQQILDEDTRLGAIRNHNPEIMPIHQAIEKYVESLSSLDFSQSPKLFNTSFDAHINAWKKTIPEFRKFASIRGELHAVFDEVRPKSVLFAELEKNIWSTWRNIKTVVKFYQSDLLKKSFLFSSNRNGNSELYRATFLNGVETNLTNHPANDNWPVVASDRSKIIFQSRRNENIDIYLLDLKTNTVKQMTQNKANDYLPSFSVNNDFAYFTSWRTQTEEIKKARFYRIDLRNGQIEKWTNTEPGTSSGIVWSAQGNKALTTLKRRDKSQIYFLDKQGNPIQQLTDTSDYNAGAQISPDGKKVAFYSSNDFQSKIGIIELNNPRKINWIVSEGFNWYPQWSPDGKWLSISRSMDKAHKNINIYLLEIDNPNLFIPLVESQSRDSEFQWF